VTEEDLELGLERLAEAGVKRLMADRYNARGMIMRQTLQAYERRMPGVNLAEVRDLLWHGDRYYRGLDRKIARLWKETATSSTYECVF
jgi:hypothetical protein